MDWNGLDYPMSSSMERVIVCLVTLVIVTALSASPGSASEDHKGLEFSVLPGESHAIGHSASASRDTALLGYQVLPRVVSTMGGDFAFFGFRFLGVDLRPGLFGLIEVQSVTEQPISFLSVPSGPYLWRGLLGYSLALSLEDLAERWLGKGGALEVAISFRHESEHYTGTRSQSEPMYVDVPHIGDFFMPDLAFRKAVGQVEFQLRVQNKFFLPGQAYSFGPGADLVFRWRALKWAHPFVSTFGEYLAGRKMTWYGETRKIPANYLVRGLVGVIIPGKTADLQVFMALAAGHDKGLLAFEEELRLGWGIRIALFKERFIQ